MPSDNILRKTINILNVAAAIILTLLILISTSINIGAAYTLASTSGIWTATNGGSSINGLNTNHVTWGYGSNGQSGLIFDGVGTTVFTNINDVIKLGTLTHENFPINGAASGATMQITLTFSDPVILPVKLTYDLLIDETTRR